MSYAEPFAGGAGLALHLLMDDYVDRIYINDLDKSVYAFWHVMVTRNEAFYEWLTHVEVNMTTRQWAKNIYDDIDNADELELAEAMFF